MGFEPKSLSILQQRISTHSKNNTILQNMILPYLIKNTIVEDNYK